MTRLLYVLFVAFFALQIAPAFAQSQQACNTHASLMTQLNLKYGEARLGSGMGSTTIFEMWASEETGTWTILEVFPNGMACVKAAGEGWETDPKIPEGDPI